MNIHNPDIILAYNKEIADSIIKHKKLGAYAIFSEFNPTLFSGKDFEDIKEMIKVLEKGEDKTGLIDSVANGIPIFTHMSFTEYFAVEFVCDRLKMGSNSEKLEYFNMVLTGNSFLGVRKIFDQKIKMDKKLMSILEDNKDAIFDWIKENSRIYDANSPQFKSFALVHPVIEKLNNLDTFFEDIMIYGQSNAEMTDTDIEEMYKTLRLRELARRLETLTKFETAFCVKLFFNHKGITTIIIQFKGEISESLEKSLTDKVINYEFLKSLNWANQSNTSSMLDGWISHTFVTPDESTILLQESRRETSTLRKPRPPSFRPRCRRPSLRPRQSAKQKSEKQHALANDFTTLFLESLRETRTLRKRRGPSLRLRQSILRKSEKQHTLVTPDDSATLLQEGRRETSTVRKPRLPSFRPYCQGPPRRPRHRVPRKSEDQRTLVSPDNYVPMLYFAFSLESKPSLVRLVKNDRES